MGQEAQQETRTNVFSGTYQVNSALLQKAAPDCLVLTVCPPCRGLEITDEVFESHADVIFDGGMRIRLPRP